MEEELVKEEKRLAKKARECGVYLIKSRDDVLEYCDVVLLSDEEGIIEIEGRNYYDDTNYLIMDSLEEGPFKYALVKIIEDRVFVVNKGGFLTKGRYYNSKVPSINGLEGVVVNFDLDEVKFILSTYKPMITRPTRYYGLIQSTEKKGINDVLCQLNLLKDYAEKTGIKYEKIFGIYNLPDYENADFLDVNFDITVVPHLQEFREITQTDIVCYATDSLMCDYDGEWEYGFIEKNILSEWAALNNLVDYRCVQSDECNDNAHQEYDCEEKYYPF